MYKKEDDRVNKLNLYLLFFMMADFVMTYIGINILGFIEEANPLLVSFFYMPFWLGFTMRFSYVCLIIILSKYLYYKKYPHYYKFIGFALGLNIVIMLIHFRWIIAYFLNLPIQ